MLYIYSFDILEEYRECGYGYGLMKYVMEYCRDNKFYACSLSADKDNIPACRLYEKIGMASTWSTMTVFEVKK